MYILDSNKLSTQFILPGLHCSCGTESPSPSKNQVHGCWIPISAQQCLALAHQGGDGVVKRIWRWGTKHEGGGAMGTVRES